MKDPFWLSKNLLFTLLGLMFIGYGYITEKKRTFNNLWLGLIFIYISLHFGWFFIKPLMLADINSKITWNLWNFLPTLNCIIGLVLIKTLVESETKRKYLDIANFLCWSGFILSIYAIIQFLGIDQIFNSNLNWVMEATPRVLGKSFEPYRMVLFFGNKMQTAVYLACLSPLCLMFKDFRYKLFYIVICLAVLLTKSYLGIICVTTGFLSYLVFTKRFRLALSGAGVCIVMFFILLRLHPSFFNLYGKLGLYKQVFLDGCKTFFTGSGIGVFPFLNYDIGNYWLKDLGFELLQAFREGGIILVILISGYFINLGWRLFKSEKNMLLIGYTVSLITWLIAGLGGYTVHLAPFGLIGILYISSLETQIQED